MRADGRTSEAAVEAHADALETSRTDARVLLWFATREGRKVDKKVLEDIVDAESKLSNNPTSENEVTFLDSLSGPRCGRPTGVGRIYSVNLQAPV
jgi:hypothetical protein